MSGDQVLVATRIFAFFLAGLLFAAALFFVLIGRPYKEAVAISALGITVGILFAAVDRITKYEFSGSKDGVKILAEMKELQRDIYAKTDEVRKMGELIIDQIAFSLIQTSSLAGADLNASMLEKRDKLRQGLTDLHIDPARIREIVDPITRKIEMNLAAPIADHVALLAVEAKTGDQPKVKREILDALLKSEKGKAEQQLRPRLEALKAWNENIQKDIRDFDKFRTTGELPTDRSADEGQQRLG